MTTTYKKSFTLIEMLIVIVIIGILAAALVPRLRSVQERARDTKRETDMNQIYTALTMYYDDHGYLPITTAYGESNGGGWDMSSVGWFLTFLVTAGIMTTVPVDPINSYTGSAPAAAWRYAYWYYCYYGTPPVGMRLGYAKEHDQSVNNKTSTGGTRDGYMTNCQ